MLCYEYKKKTRCAKNLLELINKTQSKEILLFIDIKKIIMLAESST